MGRILGGGLGLVLLLAAGCSRDVFEEDGLRVIHDVRMTDGDGIARFPFRARGEDAVLITAQAEPPYRAYVHALYAPDGTRVWLAEKQWVEQPRHKSGGAFPGIASSFNWPVLSDDLPLTDGRWVAEIGVLDQDMYYMRNVEVDLAAQLKVDTNLERGRLAVNMVLVGEIAHDPEMRLATERAVDHWEQLFRAYNLELDVSWYEYDADTLGPPGFGSQEQYLELSTDTPLRSVNVVVVDRIAGSTSLYGIAGGIPGALSPTAVSAVAVSAYTNAGPDLVFSDDDIRLYGETMAHEIGHYLGLFHPVEASFSAWDAIEDTPECDGQTSCIQQLGRNLMFPFPICSGSSCSPQDQLTHGQRGVMHRYVGVE